MARRAGMTAYRNQDYDPEYTRPDARIRCSVCSFAGVDPYNTQEPEKAVIAIETTGTTYVPTVGDTVEELGDLDKKTVTEGAARAGCPFCFSPRWADGSAPDIRG